MGADGRGWEGRGGDGCTTSVCTDYGWVQPTRPVPRRRDLVSPSTRLARPAAGTGCHCAPHRTRAKVQVQMQAQVQVQAPSRVDGGSPIGFAPDSPGVRGPLPVSGGR